MALRKRTLAPLLTLGLSVFALAASGTHAGWIPLCFAGAWIVTIFELRFQTRLRAREVELQLRTATLLLEKGRCKEAGHIAEDVLARPSLEFSARTRALTTLAWALLGQDRPRAALRALDQILPAQAVDPYALASAESALGQVQTAIATLNRACRRGRLSREAARLLIDLYAQSGEFDLAFAATMEHLAVLGASDARLVVHALERAEDPRHAAMLAHAIDAPGA